MKLGEKIRYLRHAEGILRGIGRDMTQAEVVRAARREVGKGLSQSYLSQIESGARPHLTRKSRELLARFFKVHPGFLVDDPEGFQTELVSNLPATESKLDQWLLDGADRFRRDWEVSEVLEKLARRDDTRRCVVLLGAILDAPDLVPKLIHVLRPDYNESRGEASRQSELATEHAKQQSRDSARTPRTRRGR